MSERGNILGRIREALKVKAPMPGEHAGTGQPKPHPPRSAAAHARAWLPPVPDHLQGQIDLFRTHSADLKSEFHAVSSVERMAEVLREVALRESWKRVASHNGDLTFRATQALGLPTLMADKGYAVEDLEACDAGITECDVLVAQTGSVLITSRTAGGRALSVLPPHHVVLARVSQLVPDLPAAFEHLSRSHAWNYPSFISLVTGPSRTGDIERILVLGAHGPRQLTIIMAA